MRFGLTGFGLLASLALGAGSLAGQTAQFAYAPGHQRYRLVTTVHRNQFQGGGRAPFEFDVTTTQFVSLDIARRAADTLGVTITVDSVAVTSDLAAPQPNLRDLFGRKVTGLISPSGRIYKFDPPDGTNDPKTTALYNAFRAFLVAFPNRPLAVGTTWVDTTTQTVKKEGFAVTASSITSSRVIGDTVVNGEHAWRIARSGEVTQKGEAQDNGKPVHLLGEGTVTALHLVGDDGIYIGSQSLQRINLTMTLEGSESAPIQQTIKSTVERLPASGGRSARSGA